MIVRESYGPHFLFLSPSLRHQLKDLEVNRRDVLREFMVGANKAVFETWSMLPKLCGTATDSADAIQATGEAVDKLVNARMDAGAEEKVREYGLLTVPYPPVVLPQFCIRKRFTAVWL